MKRIHLTLSALLLAPLAGGLASLAADPTDTAAKPAQSFQYKSGDIAIPAATADEPKVKAFNAETIRSAARYLDDGASAWVREKSCIAWLKANQRESGRWWMKSLYKPTSHFSTYIATAHARQALDLCGEVPVAKMNP